jgi:hypothetical protein
MKNIDIDKVESLKQKIFDSDEEVLTRFQGNGLTIEQIVLFQKIASQCTPEEFYNLLESGEVPSLKLTNDEMKLLGGGKWFQTIVRIAGHLISS